MRKSILQSTQIAAKKMVASVLAVATIFSGMSVTANAGNEKTVNDILVSETAYESTMDSAVVPYIDGYKQTGYITGKKDARLYYEKYVKENAKGTVVISHGFTENLEKYDEMIYYFLNMGYSVYGIEHRGHSRSGRLGIDDNQINVESFSYYLEDLKTFLDEIVVPETTKENLYIYAHSMGGAIAARFLEKYPEYFKAAILSSPMLEINSGNVPPFFAKLLAHGASITPYADKYIMGQGPYNEKYDFEGANTHSEPRYKRNYELRVNNPQFQMGGGSYRWLSESYYAALFATSKCEAGKVKIPVLLFQAGQDSLVGEDGENKFEKYAKNVTKVRYENARHEIFCETNDIVYDYLNKVFDFLSQN